MLKLDGTDGIYDIKNTLEKLYEIDKKDFLAGLKVSAGNNEHMTSDIFIQLEPNYYIHMAHKTQIIKAIFNYGGFDELIGQIPVNNVFRSMLESAFSDEYIQGFLDTVAERFVDDFLRKLIKQDRKNVILILKEEEDS